jgi:hypothetical protein
MVRYFLIWIPMVVIAIINGAARDLWYGNFVSDALARQLSTITALALFTLYIWALLRRWPPRSKAHAVAIGLSWLGLTLGFEFLFGHYVAGLAWSRLLSDYNVLAGRLWVLIPLWLAGAPYAFHRLTR